MKIIFKKINAQILDLFKGRLKKRSSLINDKNAFFFLTREQTAMFLGISKSTFNYYRKRGIIRGYRIDRIMFKSSDLPEIKKMIKSDYSTRALFNIRIDLNNGEENSNHGN